jgi:peptide-methionine (S)-S-oxide reductase|nr:MAG: peptide-methionine (S)-S-oxide reductase [Bacteroidota bacterium]
MKYSFASAVLVLFFFGSSCGQRNNQTSVNAMSNQPIPEGSQLATFGSGCFWCTEAIFLDVKGVLKVQSGYSGGTVENPTYKQVCTGTTGHAEVVQITYDPSVITYDELLEIFWHTHDPTTLNRQGNDVGTQYRSVIFYHNEEQRKLAEHYKQRLNEENVFGKPVVTEISPFKAFYVAEDYHQNYYALNSNAPYCTFVIQPKVEKFRKVFANKLKTEKQTQ